MKIIFKQKYLIINFMMMSSHFYSPIHFIVCDFRLENETNIKLKSIHPLTPLTPLTPTHNLMF